MIKKWYEITFNAKMSADDVRAMKKCFYDAMQEAMEIGPCADLNIECIEDFDEEIDFTLDTEELLEFDMKTGNIKVDKELFDDFVQDTYVNIHFTDDKRPNRIAQYKMISEDDEGIFMEYIGEA